MKKGILTTAITLFLSMGAMAADTINGNISTVTIGDLWNLSAVTLVWQGVPATQANPNPVDIIDQGATNAAGVGDLYFGAVNMTAGGIYATANSKYTDVGHRAGDRYTETRLYIDNNKESKFKVSVLLSGGIMTQLYPPAAGSTYAEGTSQVHLATDRMTNIEGVSTQIPGNIQFEDTMKAAPRDGVTAMDLYVDNDASAKNSDALVVRTFLDYLDTNVPSGSYSGNVTWTLTAII